MGFTPNTLPLQWLKEEQPPLGLAKPEGAFETTRNGRAFYSSSMKKAGSPMSVILMGRRYLRRTFVDHGRHSRINP